MEDPRAEAQGSPASDPENGSEQRPSRGFMDGATFFLDAPTQLASIWGEEDRILWSSGEPALLVADDGVGKTTVAQQLMFRSIGIDEPELLGLEIQVTEKGVLYIAADRPVQAERSGQRMVNEEHREILAERLTVHRGVPDFDLAQNPETLVRLAAKHGRDRVIIESLSDVVLGLSDDEVGSGVKRTFQLCVQDGIDLFVEHHPRKLNDKKPTLDSVYGSRHIRSGAGSVLFLVGKSGDPFPRLMQLKKPAEEVGPLDLVFDHTSGTVRVSGDLLSMVMAAPDGLTAKAAALALFGSDDRSSVEKARRKLERLVGEAVERRGGTARTDEVVYRAVQG